MKNVPGDLDQRRSETMSGKKKNGEQSRSRATARSQTECETLRNVDNILHNRLLEVREEGTHLKYRPETSGMFQKIICLNLNETKKTSSFVHIL